MAQILPFATSLALGQKFEERLDNTFCEVFCIRAATRLEQKQGIDRTFYSDDGGQIKVEYKSDLRVYRDCLNESVTRFVGT